MAGNEGRRPWRFEDTDWRTHDQSDDWWEREEPDEALNKDGIRRLRGILDPGRYRGEEHYTSMEIEPREVFDAIAPYIQGHQMFDRYISEATAGAYIFALLKYVMRDKPGSNDVAKARWFMAALNGEEPCNAE